MLCGFLTFSIKKFRLLCQFLPPPPRASPPCVWDNEATAALLDIGSNRNQKNTLGEIKWMGEK